MDHPYFYDHQLESYLRQFGRLFTGLKVRWANTGSESEDYKEIKVPVKFAQSERNIADILNKRSPWTNVSLPIMAFSLQSIEIDEEGFFPEKHIEAISYEDRETGEKEGVQTIIGPAFNVTVKLHILSSSMSELFQIIEQIFLLFNRTLIIQKSDELFDSNYLSEVKLKDVENQVKHPIQENQNVYRIDLSFEFPIRLNYPIHYASVIKTVRANVFDNTNDEVDMDTVEVDENDVNEEDSS